MFINDTYLKLEFDVPMDNVETTTTRLALCLPNNANLKSLFDIQVHYLQAYYQFTKVVRADIDQSV